jgi:hypothetical protein
MRSNQSTIRNLGIQNALVSAKTIVRNDSDRRSQSEPCAPWCFASRPWSALRYALKHWRTTATRTLKVRVTGGACGALSLQRAGRHMAMCRLAAR